MIDYQFRINPISTHILTKRMTVEDLRNELVKSISTHILTKKMTLSVYADTHNINISTHILTKRMTSICSRPL